MEPVGEGQLVYVPPPPTYKTARCRDPGLLPVERPVALEEKEKEDELRGRGGRRAIWGTLGGGLENWTESR